jgi:hypothetical protein
MSLRKLANKKKVQSLTEKLSNLTIKNKEIYHSSFVVIIKHPHYKGLDGVIYKNNRVYIETRNKEIQISPDFLFYKDALLHDNTFIQIDLIDKNVILGKSLMNEKRDYTKSDIKQFVNGFNSKIPIQLQDFTPEFITENESEKKETYEIQYLPDFSGSYKDVERATFTHDNYTQDELAIVNQITKLCNILLIHVKDLEMYLLIEKINGLKKHFLKNNIILQNDLNYFIACFVIYESIKIGIQCIKPKSKKICENECKKVATHVQDDMLLCKDHIHTTSDAKLIPKEKTSILSITIQDIFDLLYKEKYFKQNDLNKVMFLNEPYNKNNEIYVLHQLQESKKYKQLLCINFENINSYFTEIYNIDLKKCLNTREKFSHANVIAIPRVQKTPSLSNHTKLYFPIHLYYNLNGNDVIKLLKDEYKNAKNITWKEPKFMTTDFLQSSELTMEFIHVFDKKRNIINNEKINYTEKRDIIYKNRKEISNKKQKLNVITKILEAPEVLPINIINNHKHTYINQKIIKSMGI